MEFTSNRVDKIKPEVVSAYAPLQDRVKPWLYECFGPMVAADVVERNHRFLEESLELVQSLGATKEDCLKLVDYVYGRQEGDPYQEVGGVMITLSALCLANDLSMDECTDIELDRIWLKIDNIRENKELNL